MNQILRPFRIGGGPPEEGFWSRHVSTACQTGGREQHRHRFEGLRPLKALTLEVVDLSLWGPNAVGLFCSLRRTPRDRRDETTRLQHPSQTIGWGVQGISFRPPGLP